MYEQYQNNMPQVEDGNHDMETDSVVGVADGNSEGTDSEKMKQLNQAPGLDGEEMVGMEVENGKADEN